MASRIWDALVESIKKAIDWIKNLPAKMWEMGKNAITGFIDGLKGAARAASNAVSNVAKGVTNGIKDALDIRSPSRVMKKLGQYTSEGFRIGIQDKIPEITHVVNDRATAAMTPEGTQPESQRLAPVYSHNSVQSKNVIAPKIEIKIEGNASTGVAKDVAYEAKKELEKLFRSFGMKNPQFIEG